MTKDTITSKQFIEITAVLTAYYEAVELKCKRDEDIIEFAERTRNKFFCDFEITQYSSENRFRLRLTRYDIETYEIVEVANASKCGLETVLEKIKEATNIMKGEYNEWINNKKAV